jgi:hypothetical protein
MDIISLLISLAGAVLTAYGLFQSKTSDTGGPASETFMILLFCMFVFLSSYLAFDFYQQEQNIMITIEIDHGSGMEEAARKIGLTLASHPRLKIIAIHNLGSEVGLTRIIDRRSKLLENALLVSEQLVFLNANAEYENKDNVIADVTITLGHDSQKAQKSNGSP